MDANTEIDSSPKRILCREEIGYLHNVTLARAQTHRGSPHTPTATVVSLTFLPFFASFMPFFPCCQLSEAAKEGEAAALVSGY